MKRTILLILAVALMVLAGCPRPSASSGFKTPELPPDLIDRVGIEPGEVLVENMTPGAEDVVYPVTIYNGKSQSTEFSISYKRPENPVEGYAVAPAEAEEWVIIEDPSPVLGPREVRNILIELRMPKGATAPKKWEFVIVIKDATQTGFVQTAYECRWLVEMKQ